MRRNSREGRGGTGLLGDTAFFVFIATGDSGSFVETVSFVKKDSSLARSPFGSLLGIPMRSTCASRLDSWCGFSLRMAFCVASRAVGEGGRGAGFIACATVKGMVGILHDDITGSAGTL